MYKQHKLDVGVCKAKNIKQQGEGIYNNLIRCMHVCACMLIAIKATGVIQTCDGTSMSSKTLVAK